MNLSESHPTGYDAIFDRRGDIYHEAMKLIPEARALEFRLLFGPYHPQSHHTVVDIPAGGGYLRSYLPDGVQYVGLETSRFFAGASGGTSCTWDRLPVPDGGADAVICCAALHHVSPGDRRKFFDEVARVLAPDGFLVIADVESGSRQDAFLNGFVHAHNSIGHEGDFLSETFADSLPSNFRVVENSLHSYPWIFGPDKSRALTFMRLMFGLDKADLQGIEEEITAGLGFRQNPAGDWQIDWQLRYFTCRNVPANSPCRQEVLKLPSRQPLPADPSP